MEYLETTSKLMVVAPLVAIIAVTVTKLGTAIFDMLSEEFYAVRHC